MISKRKKVINRVKKNTLGDNSQVKVTQQTRIQKCWVTSVVTGGGTHTSRRLKSRAAAGELLYQLQFFCMGDSLYTVVDV